MGQRTMDAMAKMRRSPWPWLALFIVMFMIGLIIWWPAPGAGHQMEPPQPGASQEKTPPRIVLVPVPVLGTPKIVCVERDRVLKEFLSKYAESVRGMGLTPAGNLIELLTSKGGETWTILVTKPDKMSCIVSFGKHWSAVAGSVMVGDPS